MNINWLIWIELTELRCWKESITVWCFSSLFWFSHSSIHNMMASTCSLWINPMALVLLVPHSSHWVTEAYACYTLACTCFHFFFIRYWWRKRRTCMLFVNYLVHPVLSAINRSLYRSNSFLWLPAHVTGCKLTPGHLPVIINSWHLHGGGWEGIAWAQWKRERERWTN